MYASGSCTPQLLSHPRGMEKRIKKKSKFCQLRYRQCNRTEEKGKERIMTRKTTTIKELEYRKQVMHDAIIHNPPTDVQPVPEQ